MMGCFFFTCLSSHKTQSHPTLSRRKLTFTDPADVPAREGEVKLVPRVDCSEDSSGPVVDINLTEDSKVLEEKKNQGGVVVNVRGDALDAVKQEKETDSSRGRESISVEEESSDSLFSISIESTDHSYGSSPVPVENPGIRTVQSRCFGRIDRPIEKVLSPIENLLLSRSPTGRSTSPLKKHPEEENKENAGGLLDNISRPKAAARLDCPLKDSPQVRDISVTASLSSWLVEGDSTPESQRSVRSFRQSPVFD